MDVCTYSRSLNHEDLIDWIKEMKKQFNIDQIQDPKRVKFACLNLKDHVSLGWDNVKDDRVKKEKQKVRTWDKMVAKMKEKTLPIDYMISLFKKLKNM